MRADNDMVSCFEQCIQYGRSIPFQNAAVSQEGASSTVRVSPAFFAGAASSLFFISSMYGMPTSFSSFSAVRRMSVRGFFGQEINITTYNLCRINMFLHDIDYDKFDIACEDTLISPMHWDEEPFEVIVSNPPYSIKWKGDDDITLINDPRYAPAGVLAPKSKADLAFIMHSLSWLATNGTAAIVCFPGVMYRGGAEKKIRQYLIDNNYVDCIIQLPDNLFYGTSIATCIMVLKKAKKDNCTLFIDASKECMKVTNNNKLSREYQEIFCRCLLTGQMCSI